MTTGEEGVRVCFSGVVVEARGQGYVPRSSEDAMVVSGDGLVVMVDRFQGDPCRQRGGERGEEEGRETWINVGRKFRVLLGWLMAWRRLG